MRSQRNLKQEDLKCYCQLRRRRGPNKECRLPLEGKNNLWLTANKETRTSVLQPNGTEFSKNPVESES